MAGAKIVVLYPRPTDTEVFERAYRNDHVPLVPKFKGIEKFVASKVVGAPGGATPGFHRIAELHFPSMQALTEAAAAEEAQAAVAHAVQISSGGPPVFLVCEEEITNF
jgi:uncharacterized protein (TIGR02118 family)